MNRFSRGHAKKNRAVLLPTTRLEHKSSHIAHLQLQRAFQRLFVCQLKYWIPRWLNIIILRLEKLARFWQQLAVGEYP
jgi:hypothetical protein